MAKKVPGVVSRREALSYMFDLSTDILVCTVDGSTTEADEWVYTYKLEIAEMENYPDIPTSPWIVTLTIADKDGTAHASVRPKEDPTTLESRSGNRVWVDCRVRDYTGGWTRCADVCTGTNGHSAAANSNELSGLVESYATAGRKRHYRLRRGTNMRVNLTFYVEKKDIRMDLVEHLKELYDTGLFTDCTLICDGTTYPVHRAILAVQSPVFAALFQNDTAQHTSRKYRIDDVEQDELQAMIKFAYTRDQTVDEAEGLGKLWTAANKYDMKALCGVCECEMMQGIDGDTAFQYLLFAREQKLEKLQTAAAKFIANHPEKL